MRVVPARIESRVPYQESTMNHPDEYKWQTREDLFITSTVHPPSSVARVRERIGSILIIFLAASLLSIDASIDIDSSQGDIPTSAGISSPAYTIHSPIQILSDQQFEDQLWPGEGTYESPYIISGFNITNDAWAIDIRDTRMHFKISNCYFGNVSSESFGISLDNATNGMIVDCAGFGTHFALWYAHNSSIMSNEFGNCTTDVENSDNCSIISNSFELLQVFYSENCTIKHNSVIGTVSDGIRVVGSNSAHIENNTARSLGTASGFGISVSDFCTIIGNNATGSNGNGFWIYNSRNTTLIGNFVSKNSGNGLDINSCENATIECNTAILNSLTGIRIEESHNCEVRSNTVSSSAKNGLVLLKSLECTVFNNTVSSNLESGIAVYYEASYSEFLNNTSRNNTLNGFYLYAADLCSYSNNSVSGNGEDGFFLYLSDRNNITQNRIDSNTEEGIDLISNNNRISGNIVTNNTNYGIKVRAGYDNILCYNALYANGQNSVDNGTENIWDDNVSLGNFWDNLACTEYYIPGTANSVDRYPSSTTNWFDGLILDHPPDITYQAGETGNSIAWRVISTKAATYAVTKNGTVTHQDNWDGSDIVADIDGLEVNTYNFTLIVSPEYGAAVSDSIIVRVIAGPTSTSTSPTETTTPTGDTTSTSTSPGTPTGTDSTTPEPAALSPQLILVALGAIGSIAVIVAVIRFRRRT